MLNNCAFTITAKWASNTAYYSFVANDLSKSNGQVYPWFYLRNIKGTRLDAYTTESNWIKIYVCQTASIQHQLNSLSVQIPQNKICNQSFSVPLQSNWSEAPRPLPNLSGTNCRRGMKSDSMVNVFALHLHKYAIAFRAVPTGNSRLQDDDDDDLLTSSKWKHAHCTLWACNRLFEKMPSVALEEWWIKELIIE